MAVVPLPDWWEQFRSLNASGSDVIRDASGNLVVFDPDVPSGINPVQDLYVANNYALPAPFLSQVANIPATGNTVGLPAAPVNTIAAQFNLVIPGDPVGAVISRVLEFANAIYGDTELGIIRHSSGYLPGDPTSGIRPGNLELPRIVLPPWADVARRT